MEAITKIFTTEDQQELKQGFKEIILEQFETQLAEMDVYLFDPSVVEDMIQETFKEIMNEIKADFKKRLEPQIMSLMENNDIEKLLSLKKKVK